MLAKTFYGAAAVCALACTLSLSAQNPSVFTAEYDNARTTANNSEVVLNPATVNPTTFGKLGSFPVDGQVVGQPLYQPNMKVGKQHNNVNVLFVATMNNSVYAFNADAPGSAPLWQTNLGPAVPLNYAGKCPAYFSARGPMGILSTPVISSNGSTLYVVAANPVPNQAAYTHTLYALDTGSGAQQPHQAVQISASVPGSGSASSNGTVSFGPTTNLIQRPALLLSNNTVYVGFSGCGPDPSPYHGWVVGYNAGNIQNQVFAYNSTANGDEGGIWQAGRGLVADTAGSVYFETGNGTADASGNLGESFVKLSAKGSVQDWFTPFDSQSLSDLDMDLSTTSPLLTPDTNLLVGAGKQGKMYVLNAASMGHAGVPFQSFSPDGECPPFGFNGCQRTHSLAYWQSTTGSLLYVWNTDGFLESFRSNGSGFNTTPDSAGTQIAPYPGGILTVTSAAGAASTGIVWALTPGVLHAYAATNLSNELWNSNMVTGRDTLSGSYHFEQFTVVNGKVFVPDAQKGVIVYGRLP